MTPLLIEIQQLIADARTRVATTVNAELTLLYWQIGKRINAEILQGQRAEYGKQVIAALAQQLTDEYGKGWGSRQLRDCLRIAEVFPDEKIVHTLCAQLSWSHLRLLLGIDDPLKRDFYIEMGRQEHWSVRQLQERIGSMLFERTAISKKTEGDHCAGAATDAAGRAAVTGYGFSRSVFAEFSGACGQLF